MSGTDPAARAFEDLCAEMTVLRRSVEALPQAWRDNRPPDYTEDLARDVRAMNAIVSALRFFCAPTLFRPDFARRLMRVARPRNLPVVLSRNEVNPLWPSFIFAINERCFPRIPKEIAG